MRKSLRIAGCAMAGLVLLLIVAAGGLYAILKTGGGRQWLAASVGSLSGGSVRIGGIEGDLFSDARITDVAVIDPQGVWLTVDAIHLQWQPLRLLANLPTGRGGAIDLLEIGAITMLRQPAYPVNEPEPNEQAGGIPFKLIEAAFPQRLAVHAITIAEPVIGRAQQLALQGGSEEDARSLLLKTLTGGDTTLAVALRGRQEKTLQVDASESPGGLACGLLQLPQQSGLKAAATIVLTPAGIIRAANATLDVASLHAELRSTIGLADQSATDAAVTLAVGNLADFSALAGMTLAGLLQGDLTAKGPADAIDLTLGLKGTGIAAGDASYGDPAVTLTSRLAHISALNALSGRGQVAAQAAVNGRDATLAADFALDKTRVAVSPMRLAYAPYVVTGTAAADWNSQTFALDAATAAFRLKDLLPDATRELAITALVKAEGRFDDLSFRAEADLADLNDGGPPSQLIVSGTRINDRLDAKVTGDLHRSGDRFDLAAALRQAPDATDLTGVTVTGPGIAIDGQIHLRQPGGAARGDMTLNANDLQPLGRLLGLPLAGSVTGKASLEDAEDRQPASLDLAVRGVRYDKLRIGSLDLQAKAADAGTLQGISARMTGSDIVTGADRAQALTASLNGSLADNLAFQLAANGTAKGQPFLFSSRGGGHYQAEPQRQLGLAVQAFDGRYAGKPIKLISKPEFTLTGDAGQLTPLRLEIAGGTITASGSMAPSKVDGSLVIAGIAPDALPVSDLPKGTVNATARLRGTPQQPTLSLQTNADLRLEPYRLALKIGGEWQRGQLATRATATVDRAAAIAQVKIAAPFTLSPLAIGLNGQDRLNGTVDLDVPLDTLNATLRASEQRVAGQLDGRIALAGTLGKPQLDGAYRLRNGSYDNLSTGLCLRNLTADIKGSPNGFAIRDLGASDNAGGSLAGQADIALSGAKTVTGQLDLRNLRAFCGGLAVGTVGGQIQVSGMLADMLIAGVIKLGPLNVQLPGNRQQKAIPEVKVERVKQDAAKIASTPNTVRLDIRLDAPERIFVRGRGLDAEFGGNLVISGVVTAPELKGKFDARRGSFTLLDRRLNLDTASILFEGPMPPAPFLTVIATTTVNGTTITANLSGTAQAPKLALSSSPGLPQDELLALLLFGRQLSSISPFQAYQLAQAARELAGEGSGPGVLDKLRSGIGLDTLDVGTDADNNVTLTTGKYVTDRVFVGVEQGTGTDPQSKAVTTEIELTPSISANTALDADGNQTLGVEWKKDY